MTIVRTHFLALVTLLALPVVARDRDNLPGSSVAVEFSIEQSVLRPGEPVTLLACLTNQNAFSRRALGSGDTFTFSFTAGALGVAGAPTVHSPAGELTATDFEATVAGDELTLRYVGTGARWPVGDAACVTVAFTAPHEPMTVLTSQEVGNEGAFSHPTPGAVLLSIAEGLGSVGPVGPAGPTGPAGPVGPEGPSGVGRHGMVTSTDLVFAQQNEPPVPIPGLDLTIATESDSSLLVLIDAVVSPLSECQDRRPTPSEGSSTLVIELDGVAVAETPFRLHSTMTWRSPPLAPGDHRVRALHGWYADADPGRAFTETCIASASDRRHQARLTVIELRSP